MSRADQRAFLWLRRVPRWLKAFLLMGLLTAMTFLVAQLTHNWVIVPAAVLTGALAAPLGFATWVSDRTRVGRSVAPDVLFATFIAGGSIAIVFTGIFGPHAFDEHEGVRFLWIGLVEETSKVIVPLTICAFARSYRTVERALALGIVSAAGFAVMESIAYTVSALDESVRAARAVLFERSDVTPFGHLPWTGIAVIVAATTWHQRGRASISPRALWGFALAVTLHTMWNFTLVESGWWHLLVPVVAIVTFSVFYRLLSRVHYDGPYIVPIERDRSGHGFGDVTPEQRGSVPES